MFFPIQGRRTWLDQKCERQLMRNCILCHFVVLANHAFASNVSFFCISQFYGNLLNVQFWLFDWILKQNLRCSNVPSVAFLKEVCFFMPTFFYWYREIGSKELSSNDFTWDQTKKGACALNFGFGLIYYCSGRNVRQGLSDTAKTRIILLGVKPTKSYKHLFT